MNKYCERCWNIIQEGVRYVILLLVLLGLIKYSLEGEEYKYITKTEKESTTYLMRMGLNIIATKLVQVIVLQYVIYKKQ